MTDEKPQLEPVIFRWWKESDDVIALFPADPSDYAGRYCTSYEHVGQHGGADYDHIIQGSRPATPDEYADLKRELEAYPYGYKLKVYLRETPEHRAEYERRLEMAKRVVLPYETVRLTVIDGKITWLFYEKTNAGMRRGQSPLSKDFVETFAEVERWLQGENETGEPLQGHLIAFAQTERTYIFTTAPGVTLDDLLTNN